jgi:CO/xanthine dehydrogenase Mo-binding subunit
MNGAVGEAAARVGGVERITGRQAYVADIPLEDMLHVKLVTLDVARAGIGAIDTRAACDVPGVRLVMTPADLPKPTPRFGPQRRDRPVLAVGETKYHGEPVAAVAAESRDAAEEAARLVRVEFEELPAVHTIASALAADAPLVQDPALRADDPLAATNVLHEHRHQWGDVDAAAGEAAVVVEGTYDFPMVTQFAIEPHAFMAAPDGDGIAIWSAIQHPNWLQRIIADLLRMPLSKVRVRAPDPGGAFGGKQHAKYEPLLAFMALATGRPVRLVLTLEETFQAVRRGASEIHVRSGFARDGSLVFREIDAKYLIGAYADIADRTVAKGSYTANGPYRVPNVRIVARSILSHTTPSTAFRGFGNPQQIWAVESNMDEAARALGIDPLELRLRNVARPGEAFIPGDTPADGDWAMALRRAAEMIDWSTSPPPVRGRGIAIGLKSGPTTGLSYSTVRLLVDGSVVVYAGTSDMGQGARTIFAQIAADELGAPLDWVTVVMGDTAVVPYDQQTSASRSSVFMGNAVLRACRDIQEKVRGMAAGLESVDEESVVVEHGQVCIDGRALPIRDVVARGLGRLGGELSASVRCARMPSRIIHWAGRPRSTSSMRPRSRWRSIARPATSRSTAS